MAAGNVAIALPVEGVEHFGRDRQQLGEFGVVPKRTIRSSMLIRMSI